MTYVGLRPIRSDRLDQTMRPSMLARERTPTKPPAAAAVTELVPFSRKKSWIIGEACSRIPMPAVTLQNRTTHSSQNCGVRIAADARTSAPFVPGEWLAVVSSPCPGGTRTSAAPTSMNAV